MKNQNYQKSDNSTLFITDQNNLEKTRSAAAIKNWLITYLSELLDIEPETVDVSTSFADYGLDSAAAVVLVGDIENWLQCKLPESLLFDYPTIEKLTMHLAK
jgi:acyl carrier protein